MYNFELLHSVLSIVFIFFSLPYIVIFLWYCYCINLEFLLYFLCCFCIIVWKVFLSDFVLILCSFFILHLIRYHETIFWWFFYYFVWFCILLGLFWIVLYSFLLCYHILNFLYCFVVFCIVLYHFALLYIV